MFSNTENNLGADLCMLRPVAINEKSCRGGLWEMEATHQPDL